MFLPPSTATIEKIKKRYPLNTAQKKVVKRYEKKVPGELAHIDLTKVPKDLRMQMKTKEAYVATLLDIARG